MMGAWLDWGCRAGEVKGRNAYRLVQRDLAAGCLILLLTALLAAAWGLRPRALPSAGAGILLFGCLVYAAAWRLGFRRLAVFDREQRTFRVENRFFLLFRLAEEGCLDEVRWVRWRDPGDPGHGDPYHPPEPGVAVGFRDMEVTVASRELGAGEDDALLLANWLRRPFVRTGQAPPPPPDPRSIRFEGRTDPESPAGWSRTGT